MRIIESAHNHGIVDEDTLHAARLPVKDWDLDDNAIMRVGPARNGDPARDRHLRVDTDDPVIPHADKCRDKFNPFLR